MYLIEKTFTFAASHSLEHHDGHCRKLHGHTYGLKVVVKSETLVESGPKRNMVIDFTEIKTIVKPMLKKYLDHCHLNDTLESDSPTAEFIAKWVYDHLKPLIPQLDSITIQESPSARATYTAHS